MLRNKDASSSGDGRLPNTEPDRLAYRATCSSANKLSTSSFAAANLERINEASKNPKRLWTTIKSILHSSPPNEQLSPPISQALAKFSRLLLSPEDCLPQGFDSLEMTWYFLQLLILICLTMVKNFLSSPSVTPAEVSQLLRSMSNK